MFIFVTFLTVYFLDSLDHCCLFYFCLIEINFLFYLTALSWDFPLPNRVETKLLDKAKSGDTPQISSPAVQLQSPQLFTVKPKKGKKLSANKNAAGQPRKQFVEKSRRARGSGGKWRGRESAFSALHQRGRSRVKNAGGRQNNWRRTSPGNHNIID